MGNSLFDQLKKTGLIDEKKAQQIKKEKHQLTKQQKSKKSGALSESKQRSSRLRLRRPQGTVNSTRNEKRQKNGRLSPLRSNNSSI